MPPRLRGFKIFRPGVEACLKISLAVVMLVVVFLPLAWGYREHAEAQVWRDVACTYRLKEALRERLISSVDLNGRPCARLVELGLGLERPTLPPGGGWPAASVAE